MKYSDFYLKGMNRMVLLSLSCLVLHVGYMDAKVRVDKQEQAALSQQEVNISGTVVDDQNEPVIGANVSIKGTTLGTITDLNGKFSISRVRSNSTLVVSYVGFSTQELPIAGKNIFNIKLTTTDIGLNEVVVTALGLKRDKKALGYSTSTVNAEELNQGASANMLKNLQGKTTGVDIVSLSSDPTSSTFVTVRGATSLSGLRDLQLSNKSQPLYVLDGIPIGDGAVFQGANGQEARVDVGNVMSRLNPNDIESITILKGASAGALYGARAGNGVVMITTKSGANAKKGIGVSVSSAVTADVLYATIPTQKYFMQGDQYDEFSMDASAGFGPRAGTQYANQEWKQWDLVKQQYYRGPLQSYTTEDRIKSFMRTGYTNTNNATITGNYDKGNFRFSFENMNNGSVVPDNYTSRNQASLNGMYKILNNLSITAQGSYQRTFVPQKSIMAGNGDRSGIIQNLYMIAPNQPAMSVWNNASTWIGGFEGIMQNTPFMQDKGQDMIRDRSDVVRGNNPYYITRNMINTYMTETYFGKVELEWQVIEPLKLLLRSGAQSDILNYQKRYPWDNRDRPKGQYAIQNTNSTTVTTDLMAIFNKRMGEFDLSATGGYNYTYGQNSATTMDTGGAGLTRPNDFSFGSIAGGAANLSTSYNWGTSQTQSLYLTASLGWRSMLYLDASIRNDWYGITQRTKASNSYPSVSMSWLASETFKMPEWWSKLKLRGGYAMTGYGIPTYVNANTYGFSDAWGNVSVGRVNPNLIDPKLKPETNTTIEGGVDLGFIDNRINFEFTYFNKKHANQIGDLPIGTATGFDKMRTNIGEVTSQGIEMALNVNPIKLKDWNWNIGLNYSSAKAKITEINPKFSSVEMNMDGGAMQRIVPGETVGNLYAQKDFYTVQTGEFKGMHIMDYEGYQQAVNTPTRRPFLGNLNPDFTMGFTTDIRYKRFNLNIVGTLRVGGVYCSQTFKVLENEGLSTNTLDGNDNHRLTGGGKYWQGGAVGFGGKAWPEPDKMQNITSPDGSWSLRDYTADMYKPYNDASYIVGVYVDPRSGANPSDETLGGKTFEWLNPETGRTEQLPYYIQQGADPYSTIWMNRGGPIGDTWDYAQFRTYDATNFRLREITLSYDIPNTLTQKFKCQSAQVAFIAKNILHWNKSGINEDPETAFNNSIGGNQGVSAFTLPYIASYGVRITLNF